MTTAAVLDNGVDQELKITLNDPNPAPTCDQFGKCVFTRLHAGKSLYMCTTDDYKKYCAPN